MQKKISFIFISSIWRLIILKKKLSYRLSKITLFSTTEIFKFRSIWKILYNSIFLDVILNKMTQKKTSLSQIQKIKYMLGKRPMLCRNLNEIIVGLFLIKPMKDQQIVAYNNFIYAKPF